MFTVVWIDREHAKLFHFSQEKMERLHLEAARSDHHTHRRDSVDKARESHQLFLTVAKALENTGRVLIVGPGVAKHHFYNFLAEQHPELAKKNAGLETVDHPSDGQIATLAHRFLQRTGT